MLSVRWAVLFSLCIWAQIFSSSTSASASDYKNFKVAVYVPEYVVEQMKDPTYLQGTWDTIRGQVMVDKVYLETYRSGRTADDALLDQVKAFFTEQGVEVAGGIGLTVMESNNFQSFCYTDPKDRAIVRALAQKTARHFDEIILDDFYFNNTKNDSDIAAKGSRSWDDFRVDLMDQASRDLIVRPAKLVNPKVKLIIKFPNWYEHFQGNGYDLAKEPRIFDGIWDGNETREADGTSQHLQPYQSYEITRYLENIAPGRNGGGWVDTGGLRTVDRYAEQLWDTMLAKAPTMMLFKWTELLNNAAPGQRQAWSDLHTSFDYGQLVSNYAQSHPGKTTNYAGAAGYALNQIDPIIGKIGNPLGVASYKPYNSSGEDFLQDYFGMMGIPIEMTPTFPSKAKLVLLTEEAAADPLLIAKIKTQLTAGKNVLMTSGLVRALQDKGLKNLLTVRATRTVSVNQFPGGYGVASGAGSVPGGVLIPEIDYITNDCTPVISATANGNSFPILLADHYSKGTIYILTIPDNFNDLYSYPVSVVSALKEAVLGDFPVRLEGPNKVSLFAYDNHTFVVESYLDHAATVTLSIADGITKIVNMESSDAITGEAASPRRGPGGRQSTSPPRENFTITIPPHSYAAFSETQ